MPMTNIKTYCFVSVFFIEINEVTPLYKNNKDKGLNKVKNNYPKRCRYFLNTMKLTIPVRPTHIAKLLIL